VQPNIVLIGFSTTGKSTVARLVAQRSGWMAVDIDELIVARTGRTIPDIFERDGEVAFRDLEAAALAEALAGERRVVATGGGAVLRQDNRALMKARGWVVLLEARPETILARLQVAAASEPRPLLAGDDPLVRITALKAARQPLYDALADLTIHTDGRTTAQVAAAVLAARSNLRQ
jgi:shikimate kinase